MLSSTSGRPASPRVSDNRDPSLRHSRPQRPHPAPTPSSPQRPLTFCLWHRAGHLEPFRAETTKVRTLDVWLWGAAERASSGPRPSASERAGPTHRPVSSRGVLILHPRSCSGAQLRKPGQGTDPLWLGRGERRPDDCPGDTTGPLAVRGPGRRGGVSAGPQLPVPHGLSPPGTGLAGRRVSLKAERRPGPPVFLCESGSDRACDGWGLGGGLLCPLLQAHAAVLLWAACSPSQPPHRCSGAIPAARCAPESTDGSCGVSEKGGEDGGSAPRPIT